MAKAKLGNRRPDNMVRAKRWLKTTLLAAAIFAMLYGAHVSGTVVGKVTDDALHKVLTVETDVQALIGQAEEYLPRNLDWEALKNVRATLSKPADPLLYMTKPVDGKIRSAYGWHNDPGSKQQIMHNGIEVTVSPGSSVRSAALGKVKAVEESAIWGKLVILEHSQDIETMYGHMGEVLVKPGDRISQGQILGRAGKATASGATTIYFAVNENGRSVDPMTRLPGAFPAEEGK